MSARHRLYYALRYCTTWLIPTLMIYFLWQQAGHAGEGDSIQLPKAEYRGLALEQALIQRRTVREFSVQPVTLRELSQLLWAAQGITSQSGFRTAPSAGALYPLEVDVVVGAVDGLSPGIYRYLPRTHRLQKVLQGDRRKETAQAALGQWWMRDAPLMLIISAVSQRTENKYGRRASLYVPIEAGAAAQNVLLQAVSLGLSAAIVGAFDTQRLHELIGAKKKEEPLVILPVGWAAS